MKSGLYAILIIVVTFFLFSCSEQKKESEVIDTDLSGKYSIYRIENGNEVLNNIQYINITQDKEKYILNRYTTNIDYLEHSVKLKIEGDTIFYDNGHKRTGFLLQNDDELYMYLDKRLIGKYKKQ